MDQELEKLLGIGPDSGALVYFHTDPSPKLSAGIDPDHKTLRRLAREARATATDTGKNVMMVGPIDHAADLLADIIVDTTGTVIKNRYGRHGVFVGDALKWTMSSL